MRASGWTDSGTGLALFIIQMEACTKGNGSVI